jgi:hypothetical protein
MRGHCAPGFMLAPSLTPVHADAAFARLRESLARRSRRGADAMIGNRVKIIAAASVAMGTVVFAPVASAAQSYGYLNDDQPSVVVECGAGQRAVMEHRQINGGTQVVARCDGARASGVRPASTRSVAQRSTVREVERTPQRSKTKSALMIAGSAATGAGVGGALKGKKGALIGAAIGGGSASIYEAAKRR